jgi:uncharacterized protein (DUF1330 family)
MTAYMLVRLKVLDKEQFLKYAEAARGIAPKYGAKYLATGRPAKILEESSEITPIVLTEWPSRDAIEQFWNSPEYQSAIELRRGAAEVTAMIFDAEKPPAAQ